MVEFQSARYPSVIRVLKPAFPPKRDSLIFLKRNVTISRSPISLEATMKIHGPEQPVVRTYSYRTRYALVLIATCLFFSGYTAEQALSYDAQPSRGDVAPLIFVRPLSGAARLNINRIPDLGNFVIVRLWIDGMPAGSIGYGHTYEGLLPPGRHVLTTLASPNPRWWIPSQMILDVRSGQAYNLTAMGDGSGHLILAVPGTFYRVRSR